MKTVGTGSPGQSPGRDRSTVFGSLILGDEDPSPQLPSVTSHAGVTSRPRQTGVAGAPLPAQGTCDGKYMCLDEDNNDRCGSASSPIRYVKHIWTHQRQGTGLCHRVMKEGHDVGEHQPVAVVDSIAADPSKDLRGSTLDLKVIGSTRYPDKAGRNHGTTRECVTSTHDEMDERPLVAGSRWNRVNSTTGSEVHTVQGPTPSDQLYLDRRYEEERWKCNEMLNDWIGHDVGTVESHDQGLSTSVGEEGEEEWNVVHIERPRKGYRKMTTQRTRLSAVTGVLSEA